MASHNFSDGYESLAKLFNTLRPDLAVVSNNDICVIELTVCFETNSIKSHEYKVERYKNLHNDVRNGYKLVEKLFVEITSLGFHTNNIKPFQRFCKRHNVDIDRLLKKIDEVSVRASFYIFMCRNK